MPPVSDHRYRLKIIAKAGARLGISLNLDKLDCPILTIANKTRYIFIHRSKVFGELLEILPCKVTP